VTRQELTRRSAPGKSPTPSLLKLALAILAAVLLLAGCGQGKVPNEPFVGTWQFQGVHLVVARVGHSYRTMLVTPHGYGWVGPYKRTGNELKASLHVTLDGKPTGRVIVELIDYRPATGHLTYKDGTGPALDFSRVSTSTTVPSPSPS
jgi:hypothetical protein